MKGSVHIGLWSDVIPYIVSTGSKRMGTGVCDYTHSNQLMGLEWFKWIKPLKPARVICEVQCRYLLAKCYKIQNAQWFLNPSISKSIDMVINPSLLQVKFCSAWQFWSLRLPGLSKWAVRGKTSNTKLKVKSLRALNRGMKRAFWTSKLTCKISSENQHEPAKTHWTESRVTSFYVPHPSDEFRPQLQRWHYNLLPTFFILNLPFQINSLPTIHPTGHFKWTLDRKCWIGWLFFPASLLIGSDSYSLLSEQFSQFTPARI